MIINKMTVSALFLLMSTTLVAGQRPFFAGSRPIGYPDTPNRTTTERLGNRFGDDTTERLPIEANGDRDLVDRLSKLPIDQQPFWLINWQALDEHRKNPQTYPQKPNVFVDPVTSNVGSSSSNSFSNSNFNPPNPISSISNSNSGFTSTSKAPNSNTGNRNTFLDQVFVPFSDLKPDTEVPNSNDGILNTFSKPGFVPFRDFKPNTEAPNSNNGNTFSNQEFIPFTERPKNNVNSNNKRVIPDRSGSDDSASLDERFGDCRCDKKNPEGGFVRADVNHRQDENIRNMLRPKDSSNSNVDNESATQYPYVKAPIQNYKLSDYDIDREEYYKQLLPYIRRRVIIIQ